jgi:Glycosyl transferase family 2
VAEERVLKRRSASALPKHVLITSARNEEQLLEQTIRAVLAQTVRPVKWIIVNDGSTDGTAKIIDRYAASLGWIERLDMPMHRDRNFAAKAHCLNAAWKAVDGLDYDVIGNLDADITFEPDYFEFLLTKFAAIPDLGVAGTPFLQHGGYDSSRDSFEGESHVAGGCQLFRRGCFEELGGYVPAKGGGVDWIAVTTARMKGWKTRSFRAKRFIHHRPLGTAERSSLSAFYSHGEKDYCLGGSPAWEVCRVAYRMSKRPLFLGGLALGAGFLSAAIRRVERPVSADLMRFHRREQMKKLKAIVETRALLKKLDNFTLHARHRNSVQGAIVAIMAGAPLARIESLVDHFSQCLVW